MWEQLIEAARAPYDAWNWLADRGFVMLRTLFLDLGTPIVFVAALTEATVGLGMIFPGVVLMFLAGAYTAEGRGSLAQVFAAALAGTVLGDTVSYGLGRWGSHWLSETRFRSSLQFGKRLVTGSGRWLIPLYHFHSVTRTLGPFGAGAVRMPLRWWLPLDYTGAALANVAWIGAGAVFGRTLLQEDGTLQQHPLLRVGFVVLALLWVLLLLRPVARQRLGAMLRQWRGTAVAVAAEGEASATGTGAGGKAGRGGPR